MYTTASLRCGFRTAWREFLAPAISPEPALGRAGQPKTTESEDRTTAGEPEV